MSWHFGPNKEPGFTGVKDWLFLYHCREDKVANSYILSLTTPRCAHCNEVIPEDIITQYKLLNNGLDK